MARGLRQSANEPELEFVPEQEQDSEFVPLTQEEAGNLTKAEYLSSGGAPEDVISPEREAVLQQETQRQLQAGATPEQASLEAGKALDAMGTIRRPDGTIAEGYKPTAQALAEGIIETPAIPAVKEAQRLGIETVSSGTDKDTGFGFAIGRNKEGKVVRFEADKDGNVDSFEIEQDDSSRLRAIALTVGSQIIPSTTGAVAAETAAALTPGGILPKLVTGAIAGVGGYIAGQKGQEAVAKALIPPEQVARISGMLQRDIEKYPVSTTIASILTPTAGGLAGLAKGVGGALTRKVAPVAEAVAPAIAPTIAPAVETALPKAVEAVAPKVEQAVAKAGVALPEVPIELPVLPKGSGYRQAGVKMVENPLLDRGMREQLAVSEDITYQKFGQRELQDALAKQSDDAVRSLYETGTPTQKIVANAELINRASKQGDVKALLGYAKSRAKSITESAQNMAAMRTLPSATENGYLATLSVFLDDNGRILTQSLLNNSKKLFALQARTRSTYEKLAEKARTTFDDIDIQKAIKAEKIFAESAFRFQSFETRLIPKKIIGQLLPTVIQGNLLAPLSLVTNLWSNIVNAPLRMASRQTAFVAQEIGRAFQKITRQEVGPRLIASPIGGITRTLEAGKAGIRGLGEGLVGIRRGISAEGLLAGERIQGLKPLTAFKQLWTGEGLAKPIEKGFKGVTQQIADRIRLASEVALGVPPETMLRLLQLGDAPFRRIAQARLLSEQAQLAGKAGSELRAAVRIPSPGQVSKIEQEAAEAVFQQDTMLTRAALNAANLFGAGNKSGLARLFAKTIIPYAKTPANVIDEMVEFSLPLYSLPKAFLAAKNGDYRKAQMSLGKFFTGSTIGGVTAFLLDNNIIGEKASPSEKIRDVQYKTVPPRSINISALNRLSNGDSTDTQPGDRIMSLEKLGIVGGIMSTWDAAAKGKQGERGVNLEAVLPETLSFAFNQSFLKGTNSLLSAMLDGSGSTLDKWISDYYGVVASIPFPNSLTAVSRAMRETMPEKFQLKDIEGDSVERSINIFAEVLKRRLPGADEDMARRIDIWGRDIPQTPEGADPIMYNFFDVTKSRDVSYDPITLGIYKIFKATEDGDVIPPKPLRNFTIKNVSYRLSPELYESYSKMRGQSYRKAAETMFKDQGFKRMTNEDKATVLRRAYAQVGDDARKAFMSRYEARIKQGEKQ
jgi:hypothetical protein